MTDSETVFSTVDAVTGIDIDNERLDNADDLAEYSERHRQAVLDAPVMLRVRELDKSFEGLHAVNKVSFDLHQGEVISIIGPNGSGKSTTINLISGFMQPDSGLIDLADEPVAGLNGDCYAPSRTVVCSAVLPSKRTSISDITGDSSRHARSKACKGIRSRDGCRCSPRPAWRWFPDRGLGAKPMR